MKIRTRKLLGTIVTVSFLTIYCLLAMVIGNAIVPGVGRLGEAVYFIIAGLAWLPPAMLLVRWMQRPDPE
jgi:glucose dehydrogenase